MTSNLTCYNSVTAISQIWKWGWTYKSISIKNRSVLIIVQSAWTWLMPMPNPWQSALLASWTARYRYCSSYSRRRAGHPSRRLRIPIAVKLGTSGATLLVPTTGIATIATWGSGDSYNPLGPTTTQGTVTAPTRPASLLVGTKYYEKSKP